MQYDPVKDIIATHINIFPGWRKLFFTGLDMLLLRQRYVKRTILNLFDRSDAFRFYDAGAGFCQYSDFVLKRFPKSCVHAVDLKTEYLDSYQNALDKATKRRFSVHEADLQTYEPRQKYDLVCAIDILEHIEDDLSALKHFYNAMNNGGYLVVSTPSDLDEAAKFTEEHVRPGYSMTELCDKLIGCGFEIVDHKYTYGKWGSLAWKILMRTPLQLLALNKLLLLLLPIYYALSFTWANLMMEIDLKSANDSGTGILIVAQKKTDR